MTKTVSPETKTRAFTFRISANAPTEHHRLMVNEWNNILAERLPGKAYFPLIGKVETVGDLEVRAYEMQACDQAWEAYISRGESYKPYVDARVESVKMRALMESHADTDSAIGVS